METVLSEKLRGYIARRQKRAATYSKAFSECDTEDGDLQLRLGAIRDFKTIAQEATAELRDEIRSVATALFQEAQEHDRKAAEIRRVLEDVQKVCNHEVQKFLSVDCIICSAQIGGINA